jgi:hypothetical protein
MVLTCYIVCVDENPVALWETSGSAELKNLLADLEEDETQYYRSLNPNCITFHRVH